MTTDDRAQGWLSEARNRLEGRVLPKVTQLHARALRWRWWRIAERAAWQVSDDNISLLAAGVAFAVFLAIPALFGGLISLYGLGFDAHDVYRQIQALQGLVPQTVIGFLDEQSRRLVAAPPQTLGIGLAVSVFVAVWGGRAAMLSLISALNRAFDAPESRGFLALQAVALGLAFYVIVFALCSVLLVIVVPMALALLPLGPFEKGAASLVQWVLLIGLEFSLLAALYRFAPANRARCRWLSPGAILAAVLWLAASALFSFYAEISASYSQVYGSVAGVVILLTWLYISFYVVLLGAEVNAAAAAERKREEEEKARSGEPLLAKGH